MSMLSDAYATATAAQQKPPRNPPTDAQVADWRIRRTAAERKANAATVEREAARKAAPRPAAETAAQTVEELRANCLERVIRHGEAPDTVLASVRSPGGVMGVVKLAVTSSPLDYLRYRSADPITLAQYEAGLMFAGAMAGVGGYASNTSAVIQSISNAPPITPRDRELRDYNRGMRGAPAAKTVVDPSAGIVAAIDRVRAIERGLDDYDLSLLRDLLERELTITDVAERWGVDTRVVAYNIRKALWSLVAALERADRDFASRQAERNARESSATL